MGLETDPNAPCLREIEPGGMQKCYLVLSEEERAKGFVRPVRQTYRHKACGAETRMGLAIAETYARKPEFYGSTFCCYCGAHFPLVNGDGERQFEWIVNHKPDGSCVGE